MQKEPKKTPQELLEILKKALIELNNTENKGMNGMKILGVTDHEKSLTSFIRWLLDCNENHKLGNTALKKFLESLHGYVSPDPALSNVQIIANAGFETRDEFISLADDGDIFIANEFVLDSNANIMDIFMVFNNLKTVMVIENKYKSKPFNDQLRRYENEVDVCKKYEGYKKVFVYLRNDGSLPANIDGNYNGRWCMYDYGGIFMLISFLLDYIDKTKPISGSEMARLTIYLEDFMNTINPVYNENVFKLCRGIINGKDTAAALEILSAYKKDSDETLGYIFKAIASDAKLKEYGLTLANPVTDETTQLDFKTKELTDYIARHNGESGNDITYRCRSDGAGICVWLLIDKNDRCKSCLTPTQQNLYNSVKAKSKTLAVLVKSESWGLPLVQIKGEIDKNLIKLRAEVKKLDDVIKQIP